MVLVISRFKKKSGMESTVLSRILGADKSGKYAGDVYAA